MKVILRGRAYTLKFGTVPDDGDGLCDPPDKVGKTITINSKLKGERRLDVIIHELLHATNWDLDEVPVNDTATDIARVLTRLGYKNER